MYVYVCVYIYIYLCVCVCDASPHIYIYIILCYVILFFNDWSKKNPLPSTATMQWIEVRHWPMLDCACRTKAAGMQRARHTYPSQGQERSGAVRCK